jgi:signal transduction histidine kinase
MPLTDTLFVALEKAGFFAGLGSEVIDALQARMELRRFPAGSILFAEGDMGNCVFLVRQGSVRILKQQDDSQIELARRGPGEIIGEMALIDASPRFATAVCEGDCELFVLSQEQFFEVMAKHPQMMVHVLCVLVARTREADVVRLREMEAALDYRDRILRVSPYPMIVTDPTTQVQITNRAADHLFGLRRHAALWQWVRPRDPAVRPEAAYAAQTGEGWQREIEVEGPAGDTILCKVTMAPIPDTGDGKAGRLWVFENLTEMRTLEQQAMRQEQLALKGEMAAEIAHEVNNYLAVLSGNAELLPLHMGQDRPPGVDRALANISRALEQIGVFTDSLLRSRHPTGQRTRIDINEFLRSQIAFLRPQKRFKKLVIQTEWDETIPPLECDASGLQQVFYNLLLNAADAHAEAGTDHYTVFVSTHHDPANCAARLIVGDDGPGIPPEVMARIFRERVSSKPTGHGFGTLTIARVVREHGGTVAAGERTGGGTEFTIALPLATEEE